MAIKNEITSLRNMVATVLSDYEFKLQQDIKVPTPKLCAIKRMNAEYGIEVSNAIYRSEFPMRFVLYATSELNAQEDAGTLGKLFANFKKIPVINESAWLTLGSFSCSESFETDKAGVYAIIGMMLVERFDAKSPEEKEKLKYVHLRYHETMQMTIGGN